jgi:hypothetical protein
MSNEIVTLLMNFWFTRASVVAARFSVVVFWLGVRLNTFTGQQSIWVKNFPPLVLSLSMPLVPTKLPH